MYIHLNGIRIHYGEYGQGEPLILLHGNGEDHHIFDATIRYFSSHRRVIAMDSRGHGRSDWGRETLTIPLMAKDIVAFVLHQGLENVAIVGFSDGGNIALEASSELGARVEKLVVVGSNLHPQGLKTALRLIIWLTECWCSLLCFVPSLRRKKAYYRLMSHQPRIDDVKLRRIVAKTLIVVGENDIVKKRHTEHIHREIAGSRLEVIKGADHFLFEKNNDEVNVLIDSFLNNKN